MYLKENKIKYFTLFPLYQTMVFKITVQFQFRKAWTVIPKAYLTFDMHLLTAHWNSQFLKLIWDWKFGIFQPVLSVLKKTPNNLLLLYLALSGEPSHCELLQNRANNNFIGSFSPECSAEGKFQTVQCWGAIGQCWCVDDDGRELEGTRTQGKQPDCSAGL